MVELKTKTIINPNSCFSAILVSWFYVAGCMVLPELPYGSTLLTANLSLTSRPKLRMYATGLSFKKTTKTHKQTHTHTLCVWTHMSCCHQVQYKKGCQPRRANHYPNIKCVNLTNIHRFMSSQDSVNRPCFPHKGIITADSAHPKVMILKHAIVSPKKNHNWWHSPPKSFDSKTVLKKEP